MIFIYLFSLKQAPKAAKGKAALAKNGPPSGHLAVSEEMSPAKLCAKCRHEKKMNNEKKMHAHATLKHN